MAALLLAYGCRHETPRWRKQRLGRVSYSARPGTIVVSEDGASWAYVEAVAGGQRVVVDGVSSPTFAGCDRPNFAPKTHGSWVIRRRQSLRRLDARIPEARASSAKARAAAAPAS